MHFVIRNIDSKLGGGYFHSFIYDVDVTKHLEPTLFVVGTVLRMATLRR
jgi:hypothetical protein